MKRLFTAFLLGWLANGVTAQSYSFSVHQETYQDLQNDYLITNDTLVPYAMLILASDYRAFGHDLSDTLNIGVNGWVTSSTNHYSFALDPLIGNYHFPDSNSRISFKQVTSPGNNILKIQWKNVGTDGDPAERLNFQLWIYEKDQKVEFRFGPGASANSFFSAIYLLNPSFSLAHEYIDLSGNPNAPVVNDPANPPLASAPSNGTIYRFSYLRADVENPVVRELSVYPNPGSGTFQIDALGVKEVKAYSSLGTEVKVQLHDGICQLEQAIPGIYFLHIRMEDGSSAQARLLVQE